MNLNRIESREQLTEQGDYLVLWNRWTDDSPGVTPAIVDCAVWGLASWDGERFHVAEHDVPCDFSEFRAVYGLPGTHTEFVAKGS